MNLPIIHLVFAAWASPRWIWPMLQLDVWMYWEMYLKPWDIAAGALLVREAGGMVSDFEGGENFMDSGHIVCLHPQAI